MVSRDVEEVFLQNQEREQALRNLLKSRPSESRDVSYFWLVPLLRFLFVVMRVRHVKLTTHHTRVNPIMVSVARWLLG